MPEREGPSERGGFSSVAARASSSSPGRILLIVGCTIYFTVCALLDFFPRRGIPEFRYTGAEPFIPVWNFGWPVAQFTYDRRNGLHICILALPLLLLEIFVFVAFVGAVWLIARTRRRRDSVRRGFEVL